jgi:hypothetical protein
VSGEPEVIDVEFKVVLPPRNFPVGRVIWWALATAVYSVIGYQETKSELVIGMVIGAAMIWPSLLIWSAFASGARIPPEQAEALAEQISARGARRRRY